MCDEGEVLKTLQCWGPLQLSTPRRYAHFISPLCSISTHGAYQHNSEAHDFISATCATLECFRHGTCKEQRRFRSLYREGDSIFRGKYAILGREPGAGNA